MWELQGGSFGRVANQAARARGEPRGFRGLRTAHSGNQTHSFFQSSHADCKEKSPLKSKSFKAQPSFKPQGTCFL